MSFDLARVAPEKTAFRPVLPVSFMPGVNGPHMTKPTYREQLLHPFWQRKRLEVLDAASFRCVCCESTEKTLHVHHKSYVKGRMAWEYELHELEALCEDCHEAAHAAKERLDEVLRCFPTSMWVNVLGLLVGWGSEDGHVDSAWWLELEDVAIARVGQIAWFLHGNLSAEALFDINEACNRLGPSGVHQVLSEAVKGLQSA